MAQIALRIQARPPFRLDRTVWALRRRAHNAVDRFDGETWRRVIIADGSPYEIAVRQTRTGDRPEIDVHATVSRDSNSVREAVRAAVIRMLGLERDLSGFYRVAESDPALGPLAAMLRGMKPPRFPSVFEAFTNAVACQLVSLSAGLHVVNRITDMYGIASDADGETMKSFADPRRIADASEDDLRALGLSRGKGRYLIGLARLAIDPMDPDFASLDPLDDDTAITRLTAMRGVGRWTAEYVLLRGFGRIHIFPGDDVGGQNALGEWLGVRGPMDHSRVRKLLDRWHPFGGLIYLHLLVAGLVKQGLAH